MLAQRFFDEITILRIIHTNGLAGDCWISIADVMEMPPPCTKSSICYHIRSNRIRWKGWLNKLPILAHWVAYTPETELLDASMCPWVLYFRLLTYERDRRGHIKDLQAVYVHLTVVRPAFKCSHKMLWLPITWQMPVTRCYPGTPISHFYMRSRNCNGRCITNNFRIKTGLSEKVAWDLGWKTTTELLVAMFMRDEQV